MSVSFLWLRLGTLVMRRLDGCAFQPPAQSGSCSVGDAQVVLRRPFRADPDRPRQSKLDVVSDFLKGQSDAAPDITMSELATELRPFFRTVCLLTLRGHFPSHIFKSLHRCLVANTGMPALSVVEDLDVFEDCSLGLSAGSEPLTVHQLLFQ